MTDLIQGVYQGLFMPLSEIKVSPLSRAYTFSDSIYEVIPYYSGKPLCLDEHIDRFKLSADFLKIELDFSVVRKEIEQLGRFVESHTNAYVYYQISRGVDSVRSHIVKEELVPERFGYAVEVKLSSDPIIAKLNQDNRWAHCNIKTTSLLGNVLNMNDAYSDGCNETILVRNNKIVEGGACNIFMTYENEIYTPSLEENILPGVTREFFISSLEKKDIIVKQADCPVSFLDSASTIWFTSSKGKPNLYDLGVWRDVQSKYMSFSNKIDFNQIDSLANAFLLDKSSKGIHPINSWNVLETIISDLENSLLSN